MTHTCGIVLCAAILEQVVAYGHLFSGVRFERVDIDTAHISVLELLAFLLFVSPVRTLTHVAMGCDDSVPSTY